MGERLREVAKGSSRHRIDLLGKEPHVVPVCDQFLQRGLRLLRGTSAESKVFCTPEPAHAKGTLTRQLARAIPVKKSAARPKMTLQTCVGPSHSIGRRFLEAIPGKQKRAG